MKVSNFIANINYTAYREMYQPKYNAVLSGHVGHLRADGTLICNVSVAHIRL